MPSFRSPGSGAAAPAPARDAANAAAVAPKNERRVVEGNIVLSVYKIRRPPLEGESIKRNIERTSRSNVQMVSCIHGEPAGAHAHLLQLYGADENALETNVASYVSEGLENGEGVVLITTPGHRGTFRRKIESLGRSAADAIHEGRVVFLDARETLARFMTDDGPDWERFHTTISRVIRSLRAQTGVQAVRAYGEMVGILWQDLQFAAAVRLEE